MQIKFFFFFNEIGGNRILVQDGSTSLFLDYGMGFARHQEFFEEYLKPRYASTGIKDLLRLNMIHNIPGLYRTDLLDLVGVAPHAAPSVDGIVLSHIHQDHSGLVSLLDERIPIICSETTRTYAESILASGRSSIETDIPKYRLRPSTNGDIVERSFNTFGSEAEKRIGEMLIFAHPVDHSVLGAAAYIIKTNSSTILYTGDLRFNRNSDSQTTRFVEAAMNADVDTMICEGTRIDESESDCEDHVRERGTKMMQDSRSLVIADFAFRDLTRLSTFHSIARETGRKLVLTKRDAYLLEALSKCPDLPFVLPSPEDKDILVYIDRKRTGTYRKEDYGKWEKKYINASNSIHPEEVHEQQEDLLVHLTFFDMNELVDINPAPGSIYIHSASEPHNEEQVIDQRRLDNWLDYFKLRKYHCHCSGHASGAEIKEIVDKVKPRTIIPIHTKKPELFKSFHTNVKLPILESF